MPLTDTRDKWTWEFDTIQPSGVSYHKQKEQPLNRAMFKVTVVQLYTLKTRTAVQ